MRKKQGIHSMSDKTSDVILVALMALIMLIIAYPLYYVIVASVSDPFDVQAGKTFLLPSQFTLEGYQRVFSNGNLLNGFLNSVKYTVIGTLYSVVTVYITAYPLSKKNLPGRKWISIFFIITMYFGGGLIPTYLVVKETGLMNNMWALFLPGGVGMGNVIIVRNFFENNIPKDMIEAAQIDGADEFTTFLRVVVPLSRSIMAVIVVFSMVAFWNDWFTALIYLNESQAPFPLVMRGIVISTDQLTKMTGGMTHLEATRIGELVKYASMIVAAAPMLIIYPFVQKYFEQGFMTGAVKG
ncbi:MAG: carbohydrate ABC transporter permease [Oscillospiraceae bacterium]|nr:carbohydrate ABC transporter permease [Oscillospiraceae bacterium]